MVNEIVALLPAAAPTTDPVALGLVYVWFEPAREALQHSEGHDSTALAASPFDAASVIGGQEQDGDTFKREAGDAASSSDAADHAAGPDTSSGVEQTAPDGGASSQEVVGGAVSAEPPDSAGGAHEASQSSTGHESG